MTKERKIIGHTKNCIVCLKEASVWRGHIQKEDTDVLAGFCLTHRKIGSPNLLNESACYGGYHKSYGFREEV